MRQEYVTVVLLTAVGMISGGCQQQRPSPEGHIAFIGDSPIAPGIYTGECICHSALSGVESDDSDTARFTIDNDGLLVLHGESIRIGLVNSFETGQFTQTSVIKAITVTNDGFTLDWDTTWVICGSTLRGFVLESFKSVGPDRFEFRSSSTGTSETYILKESCASTMTR
jgi:hypothetical protein